HPRAAVPGDPGAELPDRPQAEHGHAAAGRDVGVLDRLPRRGQDVGQVEEALVGRPRRDLDRPEVRHRHPQELRLPAGHLPVQLGVAEQRRPGVVLVVLRRLALRVPLPLAHPAAPAGDVERDNHPVARAHVRRRLRAGLFHDAHGLVAEDVTAVEERAEHVVQVDVRTADRGGGDPHDRVGRLLDLRVGYFLDPHVLGGVPHYGLHDRSFAWLPGCWPVTAAAGRLSGRRGWTRLPAWQRANLQARVRAATRARSCVGPRVSGPVCRAPCVGPRVSGPVCRAPCVRPRVSGPVCQALCGPGSSFSRRAADRPSAVSAANTFLLRAGRRSLPGAIGPGRSAAAGRNADMTCSSRTVSPGNKSAPRAAAWATGVRMTSLCRERIADTIRLAARPASIDSSGRLAPRANQVNSLSRCPRNSACSCEPVRIRPGTTVVTVTGPDPSSARSPSDSATAANLAMEYGSRCGTLTLPPTEVMFTMRP